MTLELSRGVPVDLPLYWRPVFWQALADVVAGITVVVEVARLTGGPRSGVDLLVLAIGVAAVVVVHRWPWAGMLLGVVGAIAAPALGVFEAAAWALAFLVLFSLALRRSGAVWGAVLLGGVLYGTTVVGLGGRWFDVLAVAAVAWTLAAAGFGTALRVQREYVEALQERTEQAVRTRDSEVNRQIAEERLRIARDLHDAVGHEIAVISMNLGVAEMELPSEATGARDALVGARVGVQSVLHEMQSILKVLRRNGEAGSGGQPVPGFCQLSELVEAYRGLGLDAEARIDQRAVELDPTVDTAVFRVAQEALTNASKHGTGAAVIRAAATPQRVYVEIGNRIEHQAGPGATPNRGYGLVGMRERVASAGGRLQIIDDDGWFRVFAEFDPRGKELP